MNLRLYAHLFCWIAVLSAACAGPVSGQDQALADSIKQILNEEQAGDSLHRARLKIVAANETDPVIAGQYAEQLIALAARDSTLPDLVSGYLQLGNKDRLLGNLEQALASYFQSLEYAHRINDIASIGALYTSIADVYSISGNAANALRYYNQSIATLRQTNDSISLASAILNAGDEYFNNEKYDTALLFFAESGDIFEKIDYPLGKAYNLGNIGMVYAKLGKTDLAEQNMNEGIRILETYEDYYPISVYLTYMADIYRDRNDLTAALDYAARSLEMAQRYGLKDQISEANLKLSELYEQAGDYLKSLCYYKDHIAYRDSVNNIETVQQLANMRTEYEVSQKQIEVDLLNQQKRNQRIIVIATAIALFLIGLLAVALYRRNQFVQRTSRIIQEEKNRSENLLLNILPEETARELKENGKVQAQRIESVTVLFADFQSFTHYAEQLSPEEVVKSLDYHFSRFDEIMEAYDLEKIKTIGDAYMCAGGLPDPAEGHAPKVVQAALEMLEWVQTAKEVGSAHLTGLDIRIGINTGPVVAGVVGTKKFAYDIWGDAVNVASRMESHSEPGRINVSENTFELIKDRFDCAYRGEIEIKNRGRMRMYFVEGRKGSI